MLTHTCSTGWNNCEATFTVTATASQAHAVHCTNDAGLQDAAALQYNTSTDLFMGAAAPAANVFSLRHLYKSCKHTSTLTLLVVDGSTLTQLPVITDTGPALTLRRSTDNQTFNATFSSDGELDTAAIAQWCSEPACASFVDTWFDQSPNGWHAGKVVSDFHGGGNRNVSVADQPQLVLTPAMVAISSASGSAAALRAHIHFDG